MESGCAVNRVVFPRPRHIRQKFGDYESLRSLFYVFPVRPPSEIVYFLYIRLRAFEQRYILPHPVKRLIIPNLLAVYLLVLRVKSVYILLQHLIQNHLSQ